MSTEPRLLEIDDELKSINDSSEYDSWRVKVINGWASGHDWYQCEILEAPTEYWDLIGKFIWISSWEDRVYMPDQYDDGDLYNPDPAKQVLTAQGGEFLPEFDSETNPLKFELI